LGFSEKKNIGTPKEAKEGGGNNTKRREGARVLSERRKDKRGRKFDRETRKNTGKMVASRREEAFTTLEGRGEGKKREKTAVPLGPSREGRPSENQKWKA